MSVALAPQDTLLFQFEHAQFRYEPYPIGIARPIFSSSKYRELLAAWPPHELFAFMPKLGKKYSLSEVNNAAQYREFLNRTPVWKSVFQEVKSVRFVHRVLHVLRGADIDLGIPEQVAVNQNGAGGSTLAHWAGHLHPQRVTGLKSRFEFSMLPVDGGHIKPHTDSPGKLITLVVAFCDEQGWDESVGGGTTVLRALNASQAFNHLNCQLEFADTEVLHTFPFQPNQCVVFVKTFNSLHAVSPMSGHDLPGMRKTLTINIEIA
jgi:hypothetical protein